MPVVPERVHRNADSLDDFEMPFPRLHVESLCPLERQPLSRSPIAPWSAASGWKIIAVLPGKPNSIAQQLGNAGYSVYAKPSIPSGVDQPDIICRNIRAWLWGKIPLSNQLKGTITDLVK